MNITSFLQNIQNIDRETGSKLLFRGQSKSTWKPQSSAARRLIQAGIKPEDIIDFTGEYIDYHRYILDKADRIGSFGSHESNLPMLERLAELQHFGIATGLLDFTWNPLTALWFAVSEHENCDGTVFILNDSVSNTDYITEDRTIENLNTLLSGHSSQTQYNYFLFEPRAVGEATKRIITQESVFVIGRPLIDDKYINLIDVSKDDKHLLLLELQEYNISNESIYRDLLGLSKTDNHKSFYGVPRTRSAYLRRAVRESRRGEYSVALNYYDAGINMDPNETIQYYHRGNIRAKVGNLRDALLDYDLVISQRAELTGMMRVILRFVYFNRANIRAELGNYEEAATDYLDALSQDSNFNEARYNLGNTFTKRNQFDSAAECFQFVSESAATPNSKLDALMNLAAVNILKGDFAAALNNYIRIKQSSIKISEQSIVDVQLNNVIYILEMIDDVPENELEIDATRHNDNIVVRIMHARLSGAKFIRTFQGLKGNSGNVGEPPGDGWPGDVGIVVIIGNG